MRTIVITILVLFSLAAHSQQSGRGKLTGKVLDSLSGTPFEYASITLLTQPGSKTVNGGVTDKAGRFSLTEIKAGNYTVLVEAIGVSAHSYE